MVSDQMVLQVLVGSLSIDPNIRSQAEGMLRTWEGDAAPGFLLSLLRIVELYSLLENIGSRSEAAACKT